MKLAVIGSRGFCDFEKLNSELTILNTSKKISVIISGGAKGADSLAENWAKEHGIPVRVILPDWKKFGRGAGPIRNKLIIDECEQSIAFWDGQSKGTLQAINYAKEKKVPIKIIKI